MTDTDYIRTLDTLRKESQEACKAWEVARDHAKELKELFEDSRFAIETCIDNHGKSYELPFDAPADHVGNTTDMVVTTPSHVFSTEANPDGGSCLGPAASRGVPTRDLGLLARINKWLPPTLDKVIALHEMVKGKPEIFAWPPQLRDADISLVENAIVEWKEKNAG